MPWTPADAKKKNGSLTDKQARVWSTVANQALENGDDEATAIKKANAAAKRIKKAEAIGSAIALVDEAGRMISAANMTKLETAVNSMQTAIGVLQPLISVDADEVHAGNTNVIVDQEIDPVLQESFSLMKWELVDIDEAAKILAQDDSYDAKRSKLHVAIRQYCISKHMQSGDYESYYDYPYPYIRDLYDDFVVYSIGGILYQCSYTITDDSVTLDEPVEVKVSYVPVTSVNEVKEVDIKGDLIIFTERAIRDDGRARIKLISPGWGSSGYYSKEMLQRDGPKAFAKGTQMFLNHPTEEEDRSRPERDVRDLAGVIDSDVLWEDASPKNTGPGLYADVKVFDAYKTFLDEAAPHIGVSIRASGTAYEGEAENRHGYVIDELKEGLSVDYVTMAGRGGEILSLYESARKNVVFVEHNGKIETKKVEGITVDISQEEFDRLKAAADKVGLMESQLTESNQAVSKMQQALIVSEARGIVATTLASIEMPVVVRERVQITCMRTIPVNEAKELDSAKLIENVKEAAANELKYIESVTGSVTGGRVVGMASSEPKEINAEEVEQELASIIGSAFSLSESGGKVAARGRIN